MWHAVLWINCQLNCSKGFAYSDGIQWSDRYKVITYSSSMSTCGTEWPVVSSLFLVRLRFAIISIVCDLTTSHGVCQRLESSST